jgi:hypothetical protein
MADNRCIAVLLTELHYVTITVSRLAPFVHPCGWYMEQRCKGTDRRKLKNRLPVTLCASQIPHGLTWLWTCDCEKKSQRLTVWTMTRPKAVLPEAFSYFRGESFCRMSLFRPCQIVYLYRYTRSTPAERVRLINWPFQTEARVNNIYEFRPCLKYNTTLHYYKRLFVDTVQGNNPRLHWKLRRTHNCKMQSYNNC